LTVLELIDALRGDDDDYDPVSVIVVLSEALRGWHQGEPSTFEGGMAGAYGWSRVYGKPTKASIQRFVDECPNFMSLEIPDSALVAMVESED